MVVAALCSRATLGKDFVKGEETEQQDKKQIACTLQCTGMSLSLHCTVLHTGR